jgi:Fe-coproporphyrin III synthase
MRGPSQIGVDVTNRCNMQCLHCFNLSGKRLKRDELSDEELLDLARQIADFEPMGMCVCGGEPLLRAKTVVNMVTILSPHVAQINMVTNGLLVTAEIARQLKDAGIYGVQVSLDGATPEAYEFLRRTPGGFQKAVRAIELLKQAGIETAVAFAPTRRNIDDFDRFIELARDLGLSEIRTQPMMVFGEGIVHAREIVPTEAQYRRFVRSIQKHNWECHDGILIDWGDPIDHYIRFTTILPEPNLFAEVKADGALGVSTYLPLYVGNIRRHSFKEYWDGGFNRIWTLPLVKMMAGVVKSIPEMSTVKPLTYFDAPIQLDILDDPPERIELITEQVSRLLGVADWKSQQPIATGVC